MSPFANDVNFAGMKTSRVRNGVGKQSEALLLFDVHHRGHIALQCSHQLESRDDDVGIRFVELQAVESASIASKSENHKSTALVRETR